VEDLLQTNYALDTFYFLVMGALVMFMAPGFAMLEAGMVRAKNTAEILTKNVALYSIACIMYLLVGYYIMYSSPEGGILPDFGFWLGDENTLESVTSGDAYYSARSDYFFQVVFVATAMSIVSGAVAERMKLWAFLGFAVVMTFRTSLARASCTCVARRQRWPGFCCWVRAKANTALTGPYIPSRGATCRSRRWGCSSSGSAGSDSTAAHSWSFPTWPMPTPWPRSSSTPTLPRPVVWLPHW
jgi:hypothetical protein